MCCYQIIQCWGKRRKRRTGGGVGAVDKQGLAVVWLLFGASGWPCSASPRPDTHEDILSHLWLCRTHLIFSLSSNCASLSHLFPVGKEHITYKKVVSKLWSAVHRLRTKLAKHLSNWIDTVFSFLVGTHSPKNIPQCFSWIRLNLNDWRHLWLSDWRWCGATQLQTYE